MNGFKKGAPSYAKKGWPVIPSNGTEGKVAAGYSGKKDGRSPDQRADAKQIQAWRDSDMGTWMLGLVMPGDVIAIDVDFGDDKDGAPLAAEIMEGWAPTYTNGHGEPTSPYRHFLYRVPEGVTPQDIAALGDLSGGIDLIRWMHRHIRVKPSIHKSGEPYYWISPDGEVDCPAPRPEDITRLTLAQWYGLIERCGTRSGKDYDVASVEVEKWLEAHRGKADADVKSAVRRHWTEGVASHGSHHQAAVAATYNLAQLGEDGASGVAAALRHVERQYVEYADGEGRDGQFEWNSMLASAIGKAVSKTESGDREADKIPEVSTLPSPFVGSRGSGVPEEDSPDSDDEDDDDFEDEEPYPVPITSDFDFAREYLKRQHADGTLVWVEEKHWGVWDAQRGHFRAASDEDVLSLVERHLIGAEQHTVKQRTVKGETVFEDLVVPVPRSATKTLPPLCKALAGLTKVYTYGESRLRPVRGFVPFRGVLVNTETGETLEPTPEYDLWWSLPGEYDPSPLEPHEIKNWQAFLDSLLWSPEQVRLLQQWFGYLISGSVDQQVALLLCGASRGGKGVILKVAEALFEGSRTSLRNLNQLASQFGLENLPGKSLCTVDDARFRRMEADVVTGLLSIIAAGTLSVDVKHKTAKDTVRVDARLMIATNEVPRFNETTDALANRFLFLNFTESFKGREDLDLLNRLLDEVPGIVKWALAGLEDLRDTGRFVSTEEQTTITQSVLLGSSPVRRFVNDWGTLSAEKSMSKDALFDAYKQWCFVKNEKSCSDSVFFKMLYEAFPQLGSKRKGSDGRREQHVTGLVAHEGVSTL